MGEYLGLQMKYICMNRVTTILPMHKIYQIVTNYGYRQRVRDCLYVERKSGNEGHFIA